MAKAKYHVNPETGKAGACSASIRECPLKDAATGEIPPHFNTRREAEDYIQKTEAEKNDTFQTLSKTSTRKPAHELWENKSMTPRDPQSYRYFQVPIYRGSTAREILDNMREDWEQVKDAPNLNDYEKDLLRESIDLSKVSKHQLDNMYTFYTSPTDEQDHQHIMLGITDHNYTGENYFHNEVKVVESVENEPDYYDEDEDYYEEGTDITHVIALSPEQEERVRQAIRKEVLTPHMDIMADETLPEWAALPTNRYHNYQEWDVPEEMSYLRAKSEQDTLESRIKRMKKTQREIDQTNKQLAVIRKQHEENKKNLKTLPPGSPAYGDARAEDKKYRAQITSIEASLRRRKKDLDDVELDKLQEQKAKKDKELAELVKPRNERRREAYLIALANHHPSPNEKTRRAAAEQWAREHPEMFEKSDQATSLRALPLAKNL